MELSKKVTDVFPLAKVDPKTSRKVFEEVALTFGPPKQLPGENV